MPSPNPVFQEKNSLVAPPGVHAKSGGALPRLCLFVPPKTASFGPRQPRNQVIEPKRRQTVPTLHMRDDCPVNKSPFLPSSSRMCPRNGLKIAAIGPNVRYLCPTRPEPRTGRIFGFVGENQVLRAPIPPATPHVFVVSRPGNRPTRCLLPLISGHLVWREGSTPRARWRPTVGPLGCPGRKK